ASRSSWRPAGKGCACSPGRRSGRRITTPRSNPSSAPSRSARKLTTTSGSPSSTARRVFVQSLAAADQAAKLNPEYAGAHFERACNLARLNRRKEAVKALEKAVQLDSDYQELLE